MALDVQLFHALNDIAGRSSSIDGTIVFLASYFPYILVAFFLILLAFSGYQKREKLEIFLVTIVSGFVARFGVTEIIRFFYHRPRPYLTLPTHQLLTDTAWSFPSGHATFFFALAMALYLYNKKWGIFFLAAAALISISRVIAGIHYPSDILAGACIGIVVAYAAVRVTRSLQKS